MYSFTTNTLAGQALDDINKLTQSPVFRGTRTSVKGFAKAYAPKSKKKAKEEKGDKEENLGASVDALPLD